MKPPILRRPTLTDYIHFSRAGVINLPPEQGSGILHLTDLGKDCWLVTIDTNGSALSSSRFVISKDNLLALAALTKWMTDASKT